MAIYSSGMDSIGSTYGVSLMAIFWVETTSTTKIYYAVESDKKPTTSDIMDRINSGTILDIAQNWKGETVEKIQEMTPTEYIKQFNQVVPKDYYDWELEWKFNQITNLNEEIRLKSDEEA